MRRIPLPPALLICYRPLLSPHCYGIIVSLHKTWGSYTVSKHAQNVRKLYCPFTWQSFYITFELKFKIACRISTFQCELQIGGERDLSLCNLHFCCTNLQGWAFQKQVVGISDLLHLYQWKVVIKPYSWHTYVGFPFVYFFRPSFFRDILVLHHSIFR